MKLKLHLLTPFLIFSIGLCAQKKKVTKPQPDASKIIQLSNSVIDLSNSYSKTLENYKNIASNVQSNVERLVKNPNLTPHAIRCDLTVQSSIQTAYTATLNAAPVFDEKMAIKKNVSEGENNIKSVSKWCTALSNYVSNKDFKEDKKLIKYNQINDSLLSNIKKSEISWRTAGHLASDAGNKAELALLKNSPIASFVIPMKKDLIDLNAVFEMFQTKTPDVNTIKSALSTLKTSIETNKDISKKDTSKLKDAYYKSVYETFYRKCSSATESLNTVTDRLQEKKLDTANIESWFDSASSDYNNAVQSYNTFVSQ
ncbi:hypothetical protein LPB87_11205 [Flavobacterium sp. EDS]|uniref:hypothetical protein n=1 Tax=Flavobacterium sp. EDS TaxID=2897328 RepID=UPI001E5A03D9|nr:hypothetical protein [Flavobacterium sp. EDS]MCD0474959.1 hypothetical protein [Flavobacterium sp. EDS]